MARIRRTETAKRDLVDIGEYIGNDNVLAADHTLDGIAEVIKLVGRYPQIGRVRPEIGTGYRSIPHGQYLVVYLERPDDVLIVRILHAAMDLPGQDFSDREPSP